jgi:hypothetical protein
MSRQGSSPFFGLSGQRRERPVADDGHGRNSNCCPKVVTRILPTLWIVAILNIHEGVNAMKTLRRSVPNG